MIQKLSPRDWELLSAYLDRQLKPKEIATLEARLSADPELSAALGELQRTRDALRSLPRLRAPRNFTLTPQMVGQRSNVRLRPSPRLAPVFGFASALATILLILVVAGDLLGLLAPSSGRLAQVPTPTTETASQPLFQQAAREAFTETAEVPTVMAELNAAPEPTASATPEESLQLSAQAITETAPLTSASKPAEPNPEMGETLEPTEIETTPPLSSTAKLAPNIGIGGGGPIESENGLASNSLSVAGEPMWVTTLVVTVSPTETLTFPMTITLDSAAITQTFDISGENGLLPGSTTEIFPEPSLVPEPTLAPEPTLVPAPELPAAPTETSTPAAMARLEDTPTPVPEEPQIDQPAPGPVETQSAMAVSPQPASSASHTTVRIVEIALAVAALVAGLIAALAWWSQHF